ncbi:hypothetical protein BY996DRAFT_8289286, partial [Phakopsora pachyrhizi]
SLSLSYPYPYLTLILILILSLSLILILSLSLSLSYPYPLNPMGGLYYTCVYNKALMLLSSTTSFLSCSLLLWDPS